MVVCESDKNREKLGKCYNIFEWGKGPCKRRISVKCQYLPESLQAPAPHVHFGIVPQYLSPDLARIEDFHFVAL
jgi:hypothetical protein